MPNTDAPFDPDDLPTLNAAVQALVVELAGTFNLATIRATVEQQAQRLGQTSVHRFRATLAYRNARRQLLEVRLAAPAVPERVLDILVLDQRNVAGSQLAHALLERQGGSRLAVRSAGTRAARLPDPHLRDVLAEVGADSIDTYPRQLTVELLDVADVVVAVGEEVTVPLLPGRLYVSLSATPEGEAASLAGLRDLRDQLRGQVDALLQRLTGTH
jgi:protein-tyrosine-phosphatase